MQQLGSARSAERGHFEGHGGARSSRRGGVAAAGATLAARLVFSAFRTTLLGLGIDDHWADDYMVGDHMESGVLTDLVRAIESHSRVVPDAAHRAIGGFSSGGCGAANLAVRRPREFGLALVVPGAHTSDVWRRLLLTALDDVGDRIGPPVEG